MGETARERVEGRMKDSEFIEQQSFMAWGDKHAFQPVFTCCRSLSITANMVTRIVQKNIGVSRACAHLEGGLSANMAIQEPTRFP